MEKMRATNTVRKRQKHQPEGLKERKKHTVSYPEGQTSPEQQIRYNTQQIRNLYNDLPQTEVAIGGTHHRVELADEKIGDQLAETINDTLQLLENIQKSPEKAGGFQYENPQKVQTWIPKTSVERGIQELRLLTEAYRLFAEGPSDNLEVFQKIEDEKKLQASLENVAPIGPVQPTGATWECAASGIHLSVDYDDPVTKKRVGIMGRMDYHYRGGEKIAHLNIDAHGINEIFQLLQIDPHLSEHMNQMNQSTFDALRKGLWKKVSGKFEE
jgi:hypothetical protein